MDGACVGGVRLAAPPDAPEDEMPAWMVAGAVIRIVAAGGGDAPGRDRNRTTLREKGFGDVDAPRLLEAYGRHLLFWMNRWEEEGLATVAAAWLRRLDEADRGQMRSLAPTGAPLEGDSTEARRVGTGGGK